MERYVTRKIWGDGLNTKICSFCSLEFNSKYTGKKNATAFFCSRVCQAKYRAKLRREDYQKKIYELFNGAKHRAKIKEVPFDLTLGFLEDLWNQQEGCCYLTKRKFDWQQTGISRNNPNSPSLDRIDNSKGYTKDNIRLICYHLNIAINQFGLDAFKRLAKEVGVL